MLEHKPGLSNYGGRNTSPGPPATRARDEDGEGEVEGSREENEVRT